MGDDDDSTFEREREIFFAALEKVTEESRAVYLQDTCGDDAAMLARVREMLENHAGDETATFLTPPGIHRVGALMEGEGDMIGNYKLAEKLGEGGFGVVWMAEQEEPVKRRVALKLIKPGMDSAEVIARFGAERQALAVMDHPNIAKVFDAGATESGRPYFVMELSDGVPITEFCDREKLTTKARLELFAAVCGAVQHAHQKAVIHRDLKPSNILVVDGDDGPVPKVIDFGIAKAIGEDAGAQTAFTAHGQLVGTPQYMSPEQAGMGASADIDTRSDVYSLGVVLYELLAGSPPFDVETLRSAGFEGMCRIIREDEPMRPSIRLGTASGDDSTRITGTRGMETQKLSRQVRGELDWIVMKAIEKERGRRYETANAFAADIGRYLNDEPVQAAAPSAAYRFKKFARRNKAVLGTAALVASVLIAATGVSVWQAVEAHRARVQSDKDKEEAEAISAFMVETFQSPDPARDGRTITVAEMLDAAADKLEADLAEQPGRRAQLQATLGRTYHALGQYSDAASLLEQVCNYKRSTLGGSHLDTLMAISELAFTLQSQGEYEKAEPLTREALVGKEAALGRDDPHTLSSINQLAMLLERLGKYDEAEVLYREVLEITDKAAKATGQDPYHPKHFDTLNNLAIVLQAQEKNDEAEPLFRQALEGYERTLGKDHLSALNAMNSLANLLGDLGKLREAESLSREALEGRERVLGRDHPDTLISVSNLAIILKMKGSLSEAEALAREAVRGKKSALGRNHPSTLISMQKLAHVLEARGEHEEAEGLFREVHEAATKKLGLEHRFTARAKKNWERVLGILENPGSRSTDTSEFRSLMAPFLESGETLLHRAAYYESTELVRMLIVSGADVNAQDGEGFTPLHNAVENGEFQHLPILLRHEADPDLPNSEGYTPLMTAAERFGDMEAIQLLRKAGAKLDSVANDGVTALHSAAGGGHPDIVEFLLGEGLPLDPPTRDARNTPLILACYGASGQRRLHQINPHDDPESRGDPADYTKVVELLTSAGADSDGTRDAAGHSPLHVAANDDQVDSARILLSRGAKVNALSEDGRTPLHSAAGGGSIEMVDLLISNGSAVDARCEKGRTALHVAAGYGSVEVVALLLERGAEVDAVEHPDPGKFTPLSWAVSFGKVANIKLLIERGADLDATFYGVGASLLHLAAQRQQVESAKVLLDAGIKVDVRDSGGNTPLILAAQWRNLKLPQLLIDHGADVGAENKEGVTAMMVAQSKSDYEMERVLKGLGVRKGRGRPRSVRKRDYNKSCCDKADFECAGVRK